MIQKLAKMVAIVALALTPLIGSGAANAHDIGSGLTGIYGVGWHGGGWHGGWYGGFYPHYYGGYYPGHYGYGPCYLTVYGTTYCY